MKEIKVLMIGNSFAVNMKEFVPAIMRDFGVEVKIGCLYIGGCSLKMHLDNTDSKAKDYIYYYNEGLEWKEKAGVDIDYGIDACEWDVITFQQQSGQSGQGETYADIPALTAYVRAKQPKAKFVWHATWAYQNDSTHPQFAEYACDQYAMYGAIVNAVSEQVDEEIFEDIIPNMTAIQNARTSAMGDTLTCDGFHLTSDGCYIAGLTLAGVLTDGDLSPVKYAPEGMSQKTKEICIESAQNALDYPFTITLSTYFD